MLNLKDIDIVCKAGVCPEFYGKLRPWLKASDDRRLFFIESDQEKTILDPKVKIFSPDQAHRIGAMSAFKGLLVVDPEWQEILTYQEAAFARISDASDFGAMVMKHLRANFQKKLKRFSALKDTMKGTAAIVCGAGPSLEESGPFLDAWKDKALILATGTAINLIPVRPDLAVALDPHQPLIRKQYHDVPLCMQARLHPESFPPNVKALYIPDGHFAFDPWLTESEGLFDTGFTVGTAGVAVASYLGCDPIILVGMDYCYRGKQKYAGGGVSENQLIQAKDAQGKVVWTQRDWLLAIRWLEEFAAQGGTYWNVSKGMAIRGFGPVEEWSGVKKPFVLDAPEVCLSVERLSAWPEMMRELLFEPIWKLWAPMFERELMIDTAPLSLEEKLAIQKNLFYEQMLSEHGSPAVRG
jgi:uncharacterized Rossmann fold enzyme